jgi:hypothetical protein
MERCLSVLLSLSDRPLSLSQGGCHSPKHHVLMRNVLNRKEGVWCGEAYLLGSFSSYKGKNLSHMTCLTGLLLLLSAWNSYMTTRPAREAKKLCSGKICSLKWCTRNNRNTALGTDHWNFISGP